LAVAIAEAEFVEGFFPAPASIRRWSAGSSLDLLVIAPTEDVQAAFVDAVVGKPGVEGVFEVPLGLDGEPEQRKVVRRVLK
jgi:hypothetical protein